MLLHPNTITFGDRVLDSVIALTVDRLAAREIIEFSDEGPHVAFADVPEQRVVITLTRRLERATIHLPLPGEHAELAFSAAAGAHDAGRVRFRAPAVVREVRHILSDAAGRAPAAQQTITFIAVSHDGGVSDPVTLEPIE